MATTFERLEEEKNIRNQIKSCTLDIGDYSYKIWKLEKEISNNINSENYGTETVNHNNKNMHEIAHYEQFINNRCEQIEQLETQLGM